jgi:hypothetical protein
VPHSKTGISAKREFFAKITPPYSTLHKSNHTMSRTYEEEKADIQKAILYAENLEKPVWTQIATLYNIPYKRLLARANGRGDRSQSGEHNKALSIK